MKRFILLFVLLIGFAAFSVNTAAQDFTVYKPGVTALIPLDTITDTGTDNQVALLKLPTGEVWGLSCIVTIASLTGTHDIDLLFQTSIDGTNYYNVTATTLSSATLVYLFEDINGFTGRYFKVTYTGGAGSTQTTTVKGDLYIFKIPD